MSHQDVLRPLTPWLTHFLCQCLCRGFGVVTLTGHVHFHHQPVGSTRSGSLQFRHHPQAATVPDQGPLHAGGGTRCLPGQLKPVGLCVVSGSPTHEHCSASRGASPPDVSGPTPAHSSPIADTAVAHLSALQLPQSEAPRPAMPGAMELRIVGEVLEFSHLEFLRNSLDPSSSQQAVSAILHGAQESTLWQYQSCWATFQSFLHTFSPKSLTESTILAYLAHLFYNLCLAPATLSHHLSAIGDPLLFGFSFSPCC